MTTLGFLKHFIYISCLIKENFRFSFSPLLVFLVWDFLRFWPVTTVLATSAVPLDAVLSAAAGTTVVGFTPPLAAGLFGQNKAKTNSNYLKKKACNLYFEVCLTGYNVFLTHQFIFFPWISAICCNKNNSFSANPVNWCRPGFLWGL